MRREAGLLVLAAVLGGAVAAVRAVHGVGEDPQALEIALDAALQGRPAPVLVLLVDPDCAACRVAEDDLRLEVRPEELGVNTVILSRDDERFAPAFDALGFGPLPAYVLLDSRGRPRAMLRGGRPPPLLRAWLEEEVARSLTPSVR